MFTSRRCGGPDGEEQDRIAPIICATTRSDYLWNWIEPEVPRRSSFRRLNLFAWKFSYTTTTYYDVHGSQMVAGSHSGSYNESCYADVIRRNIFLVLQRTSKRLVDCRFLCIYDKFTNAEMHKIYINMYTEKNRKYPKWSTHYNLLRYGENLERYYKELYSNIHITLLAAWVTRQRPRAPDFTLCFSLLSQRKPRLSCDARIHTREGIHTCVCFRSTFPHCRTYNTNVLYIQHNF